jgi:hypothetical protein
MNMILNHIFDIIQAIGTVSAIIFAFVQIIKERHIQHKLQATCVSCWMSQDIKVNVKSPGERVIEIMNSSQQPVYDVVISIDSVGYSKKGIAINKEEFTYIKIIPPGHYYTMVKFGGGGMSMQFSSSISFTDASGSNWYRDAYGSLHNKKHNAMYERNVALPVYSACIYKVKEGQRD